MRLRTFSPIVAVVFLAGCVDDSSMAAGNAAGGNAETAAMADPLYTALAGHSFSRGDFVITFGGDGHLKGVNPDLRGTWEVRDGKMCRTITQPKQIAGRDCQTVTVEGKQYTFAGSSGTRTYTMVN